jgi:NAD-dependent dihydropyrimidine dehydrogenase PreA subunit
MSQFLYLKDVVTLSLDEELCIGCEMCLTVCPHTVWGLIDGKAMIKNRDACMECGACATNCPTEAINVRSGVGCAYAIVSGALGRNKSSGCCAPESQRESGGCCCA